MEEIESLRSPKSPDVGLPFDREGLLMRIDGIENTLEVV